MRLLIISFLIALGVHPALAQSYHKAVIFVPGFKGSKLIEVGSHRTVWLSVQEAVFGRKSLELSHPEFPSPVGLNLEPASILRSVPIIPKLFERALYGDFIDFLRSEFGRDSKIIELPFDWRRTNLEVSERIQIVLQELATANYEEVTIIAHSMGGLGVAHALIRLESEQPGIGSKFKSLRIIFVGAPFGGVPSILGDLTTETSSSILLNSKLLSQRAFCSFESSYELLPLLRFDTLVDPTGRTMHTDLADPRVWEALTLGCFNEKSVNQAGYSTFLGTHLHKARSFLTTLNVQAPAVINRSIRVLNLIGTKTPTVDRCRFRAEFLRGNLSCKNHEDRVDGDGVVTTISARLPEAFSQFEHSQHYFERVGHLELLFDEAPREIIKQWLTD